MRAESRWVSDTVNCPRTGRQADERADGPVSGRVRRGPVWQGGCSRVFREGVATVDVEQQHRVSGLHVPLRLTVGMRVPCPSVCLH
jgi:hypothetical protein